MFSLIIRMCSRKVFDMQFEEKKNISNLRLEKAHECLRDAKFLLEANSFKGSANRAYYAVFHAMRAVLALDA